MTAGSLRTPLALAVEALWAFAAVAIIVQLFGQGDGPAPSITSVVAVVVLSFLLARWLRGDASQTHDDEAAQLREAEQSMEIPGVIASIIGLLAVGMLTYARPPWDLGWLADVLTNPRDAIEPNGHVIAGVAALTVFWIRGVRRGSLPQLDADDTLFSVSLGFAVVVVAALSTPEVQGDVSWGALAFAYGVVALIALAVFNTPASASLRSIASGWPLALSAVAGGALVIALIAGTFERDAFDVLAPLLTPAEAAGRAFRDYVLTPVFWLIAQPFRLFAWLLGLFVPDAQETPELPRERPIQEPPEDEETPLWWRILITSGLTFGGVAIAMIVLLLLWQSFRRYARRRAFDPLEQREFVEPASSLAADLGAMLGAIGRRFRRGDGAASGIAIRRLYVDMLASAAEHGIERAPSATPGKFAPTLTAYYRSDVPAEISAAFVESRYAERAVPQDVVRDLRDRWHALEAGR